MTNEQRLTRVRALEEIAKRMNNGDQAEALSICNELIISLLDESTADYERKIGVNAAWALAVALDNGGNERESGFNLAGCSGETRTER